MSLCVDLRLKLYCTLGPDTGQGWQQHSSWSRAGANFSMVHRPLSDVTIHLLPPPIPIPFCQNKSIYLSIIAYSFKMHLHLELRAILHVDCRYLCIIIVSIPPLHLASDQGRCLWILLNMIVVITPHYCYCKLLTPLVCNRAPHRREHITHNDMTTSQKLMTNIQNPKFRE